MTLEDEHKNAALNQAGFTVASCAFIDVVWRQRYLPDQTVPIGAREYLYDCGAHTLTHSNDPAQQPPYHVDCVLSLLNAVASKKIGHLLNYPNIPGGDLDIGRYINVLQNLQKRTELTGSPHMWQVLGFTDSSCRQLTQRPTDPAPTNILTEYHQSTNPADPVSDIAFKFNNIHAWLETTEGYINHCMDHPHAAQERRAEIANHYADGQNISSLEAAPHPQERVIRNGAAVIEM